MNRIYRTFFITAVGLLPALPGNAAAQDEPAKKQMAPLEQRVLQLVGGLHCLADRSSENVRPVVTRLSCGLRLMGSPAGEETSFDGELIGSPIDLVTPGKTRVLWNVYAPTRELDPLALAGDYDITSALGFKLAELRENVVFGGRGDSIALGLAAPRVNAVTASSRLTLTKR